MHHGPVLSATRPTGVGAPARAPTVGALARALAACGAVTSGVLASVAFERGPASAPAAALALVAFAPLFVAARRASARQALALGWLAGAVMTGLGFAFLVPAAVAHGGVSPPIAWVGLALLSSYHGLFVALPMATAAAAARHARAPFVAAALLALAEVILPAPIPWTFGASLLGLGHVAHVADHVGGVGLSLLAFTVSAGVADVWPGGAPGPAKAARLGVLAACLAFAQLSGWLEARDPAAPGGEGSVRVGVLHEPSTAGPGDRAPERLFERAGALADRGADLVLASETSLPGVWPASDLAGLAAATGAGGSAPTIAGVLVREGASVYNSAVLLGLQGPPQRYDKRTLLPAADSGAGGALVRWAAHRGAGGITPGAERPALVVRGVPITATICFEDVLAGPVRRAVLDTRGELLVNLTHDGWFAGSAEPEVHLALARLRAIETGRWLVRATRGGVTSVVDPRGQVVARIDPEARGELLVDVPRSRRTTPFVRWGWLAPALLGALVLALSRPRGAERAPDGGRPPGRPRPSSTP